MIDDFALRKTEAIITLTLITSLVFGPRWDGTRGFLSNEAQRPKKKKVIGKGGWKGWVLGGSSHLVSG